MPRETMRLVPNRPAARAAERLFRRLRLRIARRVPRGVILHIGATAIRGLATKGDLDLVVRVRPNDFPAADRALAALFDRNLGSDRSVSFAAFKDDHAAPPLGVQLVAIGSTHDDFHVLKDLVARDPALRWQLRLLKRRFHGRSMDRYRAAKGRLLERALHHAMEQGLGRSETPSRVQTH